MFFFKWGCCSVLISNMFTLLVWCWSVLVSIVFHLLVWCFASITIMKALSNMWEKFSLTESEGNKYQVWDSGPVGQYLLAARFFMSRVLNMEAIARTFKLLWHTKKGFEVRDMGDHKVLFVFSEASDVDRVL